MRFKHLRAEERFLHVAGRCTLQGFEKSLAKQFEDNPTLLLKATGNAYPPPLIIAAIAPMLHVIASSTETLPLSDLRCKPMDPKLKQFKFEKTKLAKKKKNTKTMKIYCAPGN